MRCAAPIQRLLKRAVRALHVFSAPSANRLRRCQLRRLLSCWARGPGDRVKHALGCVSGSARTHEQHSFVAAFEWLTVHSTRRRRTLRAQSDPQMRRLFGWQRSAALTVGPDQVRCVLIALKPQIRVPGSVPSREHWEVAHRADVCFDRRSTQPNQTYQVKNVRCHACACPRKSITRD